MRTEEISFTTALDGREEDDGYPDLTRESYYRPGYHNIVIEEDHAASKIIAAVQPSIDLAHFQHRVMLTVANGRLSVPITYTKPVGGQPGQIKVSMTLDEVNELEQEILDLLSPIDVQIIKENTCEDVVTDYQLLGEFLCDTGEKCWKPVLRGPFTIDRPCDDDFLGHRKTWFEVRTPSPEVKIMTDIWRPNVAYKRGDVVVHNGKIYGAACDIPTGFMAPDVAVAQTNAALNPTPAPDPDDVSGADASSSPGDASSAAPSAAAPS